MRAHAQAAECFFATQRIACFYLYSGAKPADMQDEILMDVPGYHHVSLTVMKMSRIVGCRVGW